MERERERAKVRETARDSLLVGMSVACRIGYEQRLCPSCSNDVRLGLGWTQTACRKMIGIKVFARSDALPFEAMQTLLLQFVQFIIVSWSRACLKWSPGHEDHVRTAITLMPFFPLICLLVRARCAISQCCIAAMRPYVPFTVIF